MGDDSKKKQAGVYESRRRDVLKQQGLIQWYWVAILTVALLMATSVLGKFVTGSFVNPLKAKQLATMIANPKQGEIDEADARGHVSKKTAQNQFLQMDWIFSSVAFAAEEDGEKTAKEEPAVPETVPEEAAGDSGDPMSSQTILGDVLEYIMMSGLYILFAMALSGIYILWTVRQENFYMHDDHVEYVENKLLLAFKAQGKERATLWEDAKFRDEDMGVLLGLDNHLAEVVKQIGGSVLASETALDRYFIAQTKDIREEEFQKMHLINTALNVAPAVGFAGTVQGMIVAFSLLGENASPEMIIMMSQGIFVALVTTFMALIIKSVGLALKSGISQRINFFTTQLQLISSEVSAHMRQGGA